MTLRVHPVTSLMIGALLMAALMMLAVACSAETADDTPTAAPTDSSADASPETGNRVGNLAPDFSITTTSGEMRSLTDFKQANQPVVVYFFASW